MGISRCSCGLQTARILQLRLVSKQYQIKVLLNFDSVGATARTNAAFGQGTGPILLDEVMCIGLEYRLFDCPHAGIEVDNCGHSQDAGVVCVAG